MARKTKPKWVCVGENGNGTVREISPLSGKVRIAHGVYCHAKQEPDGLVEVCVYLDEQDGKNHHLELLSSPSSHSLTVQKRTFFQPFRLQDGAIIWAQSKQGIAGTVKVVAR